MEDPASGLYLHLDLGVRGADDHVAYRTMSTSCSPDPAFPDGLRQDSALNPCRDGLIQNAHRFLPSTVGALGQRVGRLPPRASGGAPAGPLSAPTREAPASTTESDPHHYDNHPASHVPSPPT